MLFPTFGFAVFLPVVFVGAWLLRSWPLWWKAFLLLAGIVFFGWWDWRAAAVLVGLVLVSHLCTLGIVRAGARPTATAWLAGAVIVNLATFAVVARSGFDGFTLGVVVPLGLALLVLRCLSYVIDVHRGLLQPPPLLDAAVVLTLFPMVVAGPIGRASQLLPQLAEPPDVRHVPAARAFRLLLVGLFQLWVIAPYLRVQLVDPVLGSPSQHSALEVIVATYGFTVQLFAELAGCASMAVGASLLLGFRLPENFDAPFTATSLQEFWRRWTVTFSLWLRDYVYLPIGGNRGPVSAVARNVVVTMGLAGMLFVGGWVGLIWGLVMGAALATERAVTDGRAATGGRAVVGWLVTFNVVVVGFLLVRAGSVGSFGDVVGRLTSWGSAPLVTPLALAVIAGVIAVQLLPSHLPRAVDVAFSRLPLAAQGVAVALGLLLVDALGQGVAGATVPARF